MRILLILLIASTLVYSAQISIELRNPNGVIVSDAEVTVRSVDSGAERDLASDVRGVFNSGLLSEGGYNIKIKHPNFEMVETTVTLGATDKIISIMLAVYPLYTKLVITDAEPSLGGAVALDWNSPVDMVFHQKILNELPQPPAGLPLLLANGLVPTVQSQASPGPISANGQRPDKNNCELDGLTLRIGLGYQRTDANGPMQGSTGSFCANSILGTPVLASTLGIEEVRILTSAVSPEFGPLPGAQISLLTTRGTEIFAGDVFLRGGDSTLDAADWFDNQLAQGKKPFRYQNVGGDLGGPLHTKRRISWPTYYFVSAEHLDLVRPQSAYQALVPSLEARSRTSSGMSPVLAAFPLPDGLVPITSPIGSFFTASPSQLSRVVTYSARVDQIMGPQLHVFTRYGQTRSSVEASLSDPANIESDRSVSQIAMVGLTKSDTALQNEFRVGFVGQGNEQVYQIDQLGGAVQPSDSLLFPRGYSSANSLFGVGVNGLPPAQASNGFLGGGDFVLLPYGPTNTWLEIGRGVRQASRQTQIRDWIGLKLGAHHELKGGADFRRLVSTFLMPRVSIGVALDQSSLTAGVGDTVPYVQISPAPTYALSLTDFSAYVQDTWTWKTIQLTWGARWELDGGPRSATSNGILTATGFTGFSDFSHISEVQTRAPLYPIRYRNVAPRAGLAWHLRGSNGRETVLRAGAGVFFDTGADGFVNMSLPIASAMYYQQTSLAQAISMQIPSVQGSPLLGNMLMADPNYHTPKIYEWNVTVQQMVGRQLLSLAYVGARDHGLIGQGLIRGDNIPQLLPGALEQGYNPALIVVGNSGTSSYNAAQLQATRSLASGIQGLISYTWSHAIDDMSNVIGPSLVIAEGGINLLTDFLHPQTNRGSADFDMRHRLTGEASWSIPPRGAGRLQSILTKNTTLSAIGFAQTALPVDIGNDTRPNLVPNTPLYLYDHGYPGGRRFNPAAFTYSTFTQLEWSQDAGTLGRNVMRGFGAWQVDLGIRRRLCVMGRAAVDVRVDVFNLFNHPNFANPTNTYPSGPGFGVATATLANGLNTLGLGGLDPLFQIGGPRSIQLGLRLSFGQGTQREVQPAGYSAPAISR